jgi:hypothetical protein
MKYIIVLLFLITLGSCKVSNGLYYQNSFYRTHVILKKSGQIIFEERHFESREIIKSHGSYTIIKDTLFIKYVKDNEPREISYLITDSCLQNIQGERCIFDKIEKKKF